jgi:hypothetical protein
MLLIFTTTVPYWPICYVANLHNHCSILTDLLLPCEMCTSMNKVAHSAYFGDFIFDFGFGWLQSKSFYIWRYLSGRHFTKWHSWGLHVQEVQVMCVGNRLSVLSFCFVLCLTADTCHLGIGHASFFPYLLQLIFHSSSDQKWWTWTGG